MMTDDSISHNFSFQSSGGGNRLFFLFPFPSFFRQFVSSRFLVISFFFLFHNAHFRLSPPKFKKSSFWSIICWNSPPESLEPSTTDSFGRDGRTHEFQFAPLFLSRIYVPSLTAFISLSSFGPNRKQNAGAGRSGRGYIAFGAAWGNSGQVGFFASLTWNPPCCEKKSIKD